MVPTKPRFKTCAMAVMFAAIPLFVDAAGLGRLNVLSGLGQPFKGEIDLVAVQPNEVETLKAGLGSAEAYAAAQLAYPSSTLGLRLTLAKRANGQIFVQVTSNGAIDEPVFNLLVDLSWLGGRIQREYTALIDPVGYSATPGGAVVTPVPATDGIQLPQDKITEPRPAVSTAITPPKATISSRPVKTAPTASTPLAQSGESYQVKAGDTLSTIAGRVQPAGVSLEQVLVGLYRANPDAFDGNMNRLKRGKILQVPVKSDLEAVSTPEAIKEIKAQAANWQNYRRQLAESAVKAPAAETAEPAAGGRITAKVEDKGAKVADKSKDVLKLSRGASKTDDSLNRVRALEEEAAARKKALDEANQRVIELQKNIKKMEELAVMRSKSGAELQQKAEQTVAPPAKSNPVVASAIPVVASAPVAASIPAEKASEVVPAAVASVTSSAPAKPRRVAPPPPAPEPGVLDLLMDNLLPIGGGLAAILLGIGGMLWSRNRRRPSVFENSLITSGDLKPNTVLGRTGGGVISTQAENSFLTDFSRQGLGTIDTDEVDPIAEADVYMAYGRNAQAEEILKDALVKDPHRQEIRLKLLDIYAARKDKTAFEEVAADLYAATGGVGQQWEQAVYLGRGIDPENPLYANKGAEVAPAMVTAALAAVSTLEGDAGESDHDVAAFTAALEDDSSLDFEFEMPAVESESTSELESMQVSDDLEEKLDVAAEKATEASPEAAELSFGLDLGVSLESEPAIAEEEVVETATEAENSLMELDLPIDFGKSFDETEPVPGVMVELETPETVAEMDTLESSDHSVVTSDFATADLSIPDLDLNLDLGSIPNLESSLETTEEEQAIAEFSAQLSSNDATDFELPDVMAEETEAIDLKFDFPSELPVSPSATEAVVPDAPIDLNLEISDASMGMDFMEDDPVQTKIDLARAYIDMGDVEGAREILQEAEQEGNPQQQELARSFLTNL